MLPNANVVVGATPGTTTTGETPAPVIPQGVTPTTPTEPTTPTPTLPTVSELMAQLADRDAALKSTRIESIDRRKKLDLFEKAQADADIAKLSEIEKATKRADAAELRIKEHQSQLVARDIQIRALQLGFVDHQDAIGLLSGKIEYDADGQPTNLDKALSDLATAKPYLLKQPDATPPRAANPGATNPGRAIAGSGVLEVTYEQYNAMGKDPLIGQAKRIQMAREGKLKIISN